MGWGTCPLEVEVNALESHVYVRNWLDSPCMYLSQSLLERQALDPEHQARSKIIFTWHGVVPIFCSAFSRWRFNADSETQINKAFLNHDGDLPLLKSSLSLAKLNLMPPFNETICYKDIKSLNNFVFYEVKLWEISSEMLSNLNSSACSPVEGNPTQEADTLEAHG